MKIQQYGYFHLIVFKNDEKYQVDSYKQNEMTIRLINNGHYGYNNSQPITVEDLKSNYKIKKRVFKNGSFEIITN